jgi:hypothetical protein
LNIRYLRIWRTIQWYRLHLAPSMHRGNHLIYRRRSTEAPRRERSSRKTARAVFCASHPPSAIAPSAPRETASCISVLMNLDAGWFTVSLAVPSLFPPRHAVTSLFPRCVSISSTVYPTKLLEFESHLPRSKRFTFLKHSLRPPPLELMEPHLVPVARLFLVVAPQLTGILLEFHLRPRLYHWIPPINRY